LTRQQHQSSIYVDPPLGRQRLKEEMGSSISQNTKSKQENKKKNLSVVVPDFKRDPQPSEQSMQELLARWQFPKLVMMKVAIAFSPTP